MELSDQILERMDRYFSEKMEANERAAMKKELDEDAAYAELYALFRASMEAVRLAGRELDRDKLKVIEERIKADQNKKKKGGKSWLGRKWWVLVATLFLLVTPILIIRGFSSEMDHSLLFKAYFEPYSNKLTMMSGSQSESLTLAMGHYDQAAYQLALKAFSSLGDEAALDKGLLLLYQGICYLEIGQELKAKAHFSQVLEIPGTRLAGPAAWYLGLTHLKLGDLSQAKQFFRQAATLDSAYKGQVEAVLQDLG